MRLPSLCHRLSLTLLCLAVVGSATADQVIPPAATNATVFVVDSDRSWLRVLVFRGGLLGGLGHNHVVSHHDLHGDVTLADESAMVELRLSADDFVIDDPELRKEEGADFPGAMSPKDIEGTRKNMLGRKLLAAGQYPEIGVQTTVAVPILNGLTADVVFSIKGRDHAVRVPVALQLDDSSFVAKGSFSVSHAELGLKPFKAALGALRVHKTLRIKFEIYGTSKP